MYNVLKANNVSKSEISTKMYKIKYLKYIKIDDKTEYY